MILYIELQSLDDILSYLLHPEEKVLNPRMVKKRFRCNSNLKRFFLCHYQGYMLFLAPTQGVPMRFFTGTFTLFNF
jgi:hypothetical protein